MDKMFYKIMHCKLGLSTWLSIQSIFMNTLLLTFLISTPEFRSWQFFPLMMQATIDIVGPGFANLVYEWQIFKYLPVLEEKIIELFSCSPASIRNSNDLLTIYGTLECLIMNLRCLLNEYSTGFCLLAVSLYRYLLVCHPTFTVNQRFYKTVAGLLVSVLVLSVLGSIFHLMLFKEYSEGTDMDSLSLVFAYAPALSKFVQERKNDSNENLLCIVLIHFEELKL